MSMRRLTGLHMISGASILALGLTVASSARAQLEVTSDRMVSRFVASGKEERVGFFWGLNDDCTVQRGFNVSIAQLPRQGQARLEKTLQVLGRRLLARISGSGLQAERLRRCVGVEVPVISLFYRSQPGFVGFDELVVLRTTPDGRRQQRRDVRIAVRP
ncbi:hypothetical protein [Bosea sp. AAP35]|uniref:hypothetical protein n=1 Tax=Bosea sp. AAP35 TaxID=1523417 RepID=UPI0012E1D555|nr:hypothetical protein [Bosea sp. AAP35]